MTRSHSGKYVPFDVFELYQDKAFENALNSVFQMMLDTPLDDMMVGREKRWSIFLIQISILTSSKPS